VTKRKILKVSGSPTLSTAHALALVAKIQREPVVSGAVKSGSAAMLRKKYLGHFGSAVRRASNTVPVRAGKTS
jgi:hypothetical protein